LSVTDFLPLLSLCCKEGLQGVCHIFRGRQTSFHALHLGQMHHVFNARIHIHLFGLSFLRREHVEVEEGPLLVA